MQRKIAGKNKGWKGYGPKLAVTFNPEHLETLRQTAQAEGISVSQAVRDVISAGLRARQEARTDE